MDNVNVVEIKPKKWKDYNVYVLELLRYKKMLQENIGLARLHT